MNSNKKISITTGLLFLLAAVTSIAALILYDSILNDVGYIVKAPEKESLILWGAFFEIILAFSVVGTALTLYPVLKKYNESLALGTVCFRLLESAMILIGIICLLTVVTLNHEFINEDNPDVNSFLIVGKLLIGAHNWTFLYGPNLLLGPSTLMTSYLLYKAKVVPHFISIAGLIGGPLIFTCALLVMFGAFEQLSPIGVLFALPVFFYEMSLAVYLIVKGLKSNLVLPATKHNLFQLSAESNRNSRIK